MKIKFNLYERVAGLFVLGAIFGGVAITFGIAIQKGWFEPKIKLATVLESADGVRVGTQVQLAGLRVGSVTKVELKSKNEVHVMFEISEEFHSRVRQDSVVRMIRPFIIGEKVLEISVGSAEMPKVSKHEVLRAEPTVDVMDLISGRTLGPYLKTMGQMMDNLKYVAEAILAPERSKAIVKMFDEINPLLKTMSGMSKEATSLLRQLNRKRKLSVVIDNLNVLTSEMNRILPTVSLLVKDSPQLAADLSKIAHNMALLTDEIQKALPEIQTLGPELPRVSRRAIEALDETVVTLKALQKSFLLRGNVEDVREEEAARGQRLPAGESGASKSESAKSGALSP